MNETFYLKPTAPFRLDLTAWTLRRRPDNSIDRWDGKTYRRVIVLDGQTVELQVTQTAPPDSRRLLVTVVGATLSQEIRTQATASLERLLGIRIDLTGFYALAAGDPKLGPLAARFRGMKPPRFATLFETFANAIACQQITLTQGIRLLNRLAQDYGPCLEEQHGFPGARAVAAVNPDVLRQLGFSNQRASYLTGVARTVSEGSLDLQELTGMDNAAARERLMELRGVGRWTAEYVLLRGLGRMDVFPGDDVGAWSNLKRWLGLRKPLDYRRAQQIVSRWQPYAGLIYFHLLLDRLDAAGYLSAEQSAMPRTSQAQPEHGAG